MKRRTFFARISAALAGLALGAKLTPRRGPTTDEVAELADQLDRAYLPYRSYSTGPIRISKELLESAAIDPERLTMESMARRYAYLMDTKPVRS